MKDFRKNIETLFERDEELEHLDDSEILLNFRNALVVLWPSLIKINLLGDDEWDALVDQLWQSLVVNTFKWKYGLCANDNFLGKYSLGLSSKTIIQCNFSHHLSKVFDCFGQQVKLDAGNSYRFKSFTEIGVDLSAPSSHNFESLSTEEIDFPLQTPNEMRFEFTEIVDYTKPSESFFISHTDCKYELILMD